jgi:hypothetical protein
MKPSTLVLSLVFSVSLILANTHSYAADPAPKTPQVGFELKAKLVPATEKGAKDTVVLQYRIIDKSKDKPVTIAEPKITTYMKEEASLKLAGDKDLLKIIATAKSEKLVHSKIVFEKDGKIVSQVEHNSAISGEWVTLQ